MSAHLSCHGSFAHKRRKASGHKDARVRQARHMFAMSRLAEDGSLAVLQAVLSQRDLKTTIIRDRVTHDPARREVA